MSTPLILLGLVAASPRHGYDLKRAHDSFFPQARPLAFGQVYATLERLERDGFIESTDLQSGNGPDRIVYRLTAAGRNELDVWIDAPEPPYPFVSNVLFAKVVLALLLGSSASNYLHAQRALHMRRMRELTAMKTAAGVSLSSVISADYAIAHLDADLRWIDLTSRRLDLLRKEVVK